MALPPNAQIQFDGYGRPNSPLFSLTRPKGSSEIDNSYAQIILDALECRRTGCQCHASVRRGHGRTHCPAHPDEGHPSLSVDPKGDTTTWKCHKGCPQLDVVKALAARKLLPEWKPPPMAQSPVRRPVVTNTAPAPEPKPEPQKGDPDYQGPDDEGTMPQPGNHLIRMNDGKWLWKGMGAKPDPYKVIDPSVWDEWEEKTGLSEAYTTSQGVYYDADMRALIFPFDGLDVYKYRPWPPTEQKYGWPAGSKPPALWPLPDPDFQGNRVFLTAGETDCLSLRYHGYPAFAVTAGEAKPCPATALADFAMFGVERIYVVFDADPAGSDGAQKQAACAFHAGYEVYVFFPPLVAMRGKKDVNDLHVLTQRTEGLFEKWFDQAVEKAHRWSPSHPGPFLRTEEPQTTQEVPMRRTISVPSYQGE